MYRSCASSAVAAALVLCPAFAQDDVPLSTAELAHCAELVQTLRSQSQRLNQQAAEFDARRQALAAQWAELQAQAPGSGTGAGGSAGAETLIRYNAESAAFNKEIAAFRAEVVAINAVKREYERLCANRPYRHADLEALPAPAREAMVKGLADVRVPFTDQGAD